jgi:hypothetical protein
MRSVALQPLPTARLDLAEVFRVRAEARALLVYASEMTLHEAVDGLQLSARENGLIGMIGQDAVQAIMSTAFGVIREIEEAQHA